MIHLNDRASMERARTITLDRHLRRLLARHIDHLTSGSTDLTEWTEFLIVQPGDTEADIVRYIGFSPLIEPINGTRYPAAGFQPFWDWLGSHDGWFEMIVTFGSTFAYILFVENADGVPTDLLALCRRYAGDRA